MTAMKNFLRTAFIVCALFVFFYPIIRFNRTAVVSQKENRNLAVRPLPIKNNDINRNLFAEYSAYLDDRFGGRQHLIDFNNTVNQKILHKRLFNSKAMQGKNGWWFYISAGDGNNYADFMKQNVLMPENLALWKENVKNTAEWCETNGIKSIFLICPNKHSIYPEYYPFSRPDGITRADQLSAVLDSLGVSYVFPRDYILSQKSAFAYPLYYETDTHWNPQGAYCAFELLREKICAAFPETAFPNIKYTAEISESDTAGDILPMLNIKSAKSTRPVLSPDGAENSDFYEYIKNEGRNGVITRSKDSRLPRALIFRDSFFTALEPFTSPLFSEAEYYWRTFSDADKEAVLAFNPDIIIFERVERGAQNLVQCSK